MAAPVPASVGTFLTGANGTSAVVAVPAGVAAGDIILVFLYKENTAAVSNGTGATGFAEITTAPTTTAPQAQHVLWKRASAADTGTYTFNWTGSNWREAVAVRVTGCIPTGSPFDTSAGAPTTAASSSSSGVSPGVALTTQDVDRLLILAASNFASGTWGSLLPAASGSQSAFAFQTSGATAMTVATATRGTGGATGTATATCSGSGARTAWLIALIPAPVDPPRRPARQRPRFPSWPRRGRFRSGPLATPDPNLPLVADGGLGTDTFTVVEQVTVADTGTGTDTFVAVETEFPSSGDTGTGSDTITVLDVPFTPLLPLRNGPTYEVLVMARVPAAASAPTFLTVDPISWSTLDWTTELSKPQTLDLTCKISTITESILQRFRRPHALATELWLLRDGRTVFAGPLAGGRREGETLTLHADGLLAYLQRMVVYADLVFSQVDQFAIVKALVDHWQTRPYGNFGIDTSTAGTSGVLRDATYLKSELHRILQRVQEMGLRQNGFDVDVDPQSRALQLWYPQRGIDRSAGEDAIVFDARNITNPSTMFSVAPDDVATEAFGTGTSTDNGGSLYGAATNADLRAQYGASAVTGTWDSVSEQPTLDAHLQALLAARAETLFVPGPNVRVTPDADLANYAAGDTVRYEVDDQLGINGGFRLRSVKVSVSSNGAVETVTPGFA